MDHQIPSAFVCVIGNDGTGKSTMCNLVNQRTIYSCAQRSMKNSQDQNIRQLVAQIRKIDKLTYSYAFQDDWYNFDISHFIEVKGVKVRVHWVLLTAPVQVIKKRIQSRPDMTIYQHEKCIKYFNYVYEEMAYFYGMNLVKSDQPKQKTLQDIINIVENSKINLPIRTLSLQLLTKHQLQNNLIQHITQQQAQIIYDQKILPEIQKSGMKNFYFPELYDFVQKIQVKKRMASRWIKNHAQRQFKQQQLIFKYIWALEEQQKQQIIKISKQQFYFQNIVEGQSKILYKIISDDKILKSNFNKKVLIFLKSTIYSHTNQRTAQISQLGKIRAKGSMIFLEMLKRNHINHSYITLNRDGIILSKFVETNDLQIVFKKQCLGTDKHSFIGLKNNLQICNQKGVYKGGIYVRFDWRNPNHFLNSSSNITLNLDPYYYLIQKIAGKQIFFGKFLTNEKCKPVGDRCISQDVVSSYTNTKLIKQKTIQAYCTFQYYAHEVGLEILDGCMMIDKNCQYIWSQINPDCLRVKSIKERQDYDKDIWRAGGSSSKQVIMKKWSIFNQIYIQYFKKNRFMDSEVTKQLLCKQIYAAQILNQGDIRQGYKHFYRNLYRGQRQRQVIGTIDIINGQPILVQSSQFKQKHSNADINAALQYISIVPQVLLVDIDGASGKQKNNKSLITQISKRSNINLYAVGGGIRNVQIANQYLSQFQHIIISSNLDIITEIPIEKRSKIIVELSVNQKNQILTHARTINTGINVIKKMIQLCQLKIQNISITFNNAQGKLKGLPRQQIRSLMYQIPGPIKKVIIAGGISTIDDLQFIWGFPKCVPQLGSAIWKKKVLIGQIFSKIVRYDQNDLIPTVIQNSHGKNLGLIYLNQQALIKTCQQRQLYRYSRQHKRLLKKGEQSGNTQKILSINTDCDNDTLLITVGQQHPIFCHKNTQSCFYQQINKSKFKNLQQIQQHILKSKQGGGSGYSYILQNNPKRAINKVFEQVQQLSVAQNKQRKTQQCADVLAHLMMYLNSQDIKMNEVINVLNYRAKKQRRVKKQNKQQQNTIKIGIAAGKHTKFIYDALQQFMGVRISPHSKGKQRNYTINYQIINQQKFQKILNLPNKDTKIIFFSVKPKDIVKLIQKNYIKFGINYSNVVENSCDKYICHASKKIDGLRLALIKRKGQNIHVQKWSEINKGKIISQYPSNLAQYFINKNIPSNYYSLIKVSGHSQGFLQDKNFDYCDAIVYSGKTIEDNNLQIQAIIKEQINVILFSLTN